MHYHSESEGNKLMKDTIFQLLQGIEGLEKRIFTHYDEQNRFYKRKRDDTDSILMRLSTDHDNNEIKIAGLTQEISYFEKLIEIDSALLKSKEETLALEFSPDYSFVDEVNHQLNGARSLNDELQAFLKFFEDNLGLIITSSNSSVVFKFQHITKTSKNEHSIAISHKNGLYLLNNCWPYLPEIEGLLKDLNLTNDLSRFIKAVRAHFKRLYS